MHRLFVDIQQRASRAGAISRMMKHPLLLAAALPLSACTLVPNSPIVESQREVAQQGSAVGLLQPVQLGRAVVTPMRVTEDSRCPINARCVWAGRVVLETRIDGHGWRQTQPLVLGEPHTVRDVTVTLTEVSPGHTTDRRVTSAEYRFRFSGS
jgi:hypothetical protein